MKNKIVLVTGSTRGIGKQIAIAYLKTGATVIVNGRSERALEDMVASSKEFGAVHGISADVGSAADVAVFMAQVTSEFGRLDVLVNNAAERSRAEITELKESLWDRTFATNVKGPFLLIQAALPLMREGASIVNIASIAAIHPPSYYRGVHYIASKGALLALTRGLALELAVRGIRVNAIAPGVVSGDKPRPEAERFAREHTQLKRPLSEQEVVELCLFLTSDKASGITGEMMIVGR